MEEDLIGKVFQQNCGDSLLVLEKIKPEGSNRYLYRCIFQKYFYEVICQKVHLKNGNVYNPLIEEKEFIGNIFKQNCGDSIKVLEKVKDKKFKVEFQKYPYITFCDKRSILNGSVINPLIKQSLIEKEFLQKNGYSIIIKEYKRENKNGDCLCYFKEYPSIILCKRVKDIINGDIKDFEIEHFKLINSIWHQNCGDDLKIKKYLKNGYYLCEFINLSYEKEARLDTIKAGNVQNPLINSKSEYMKEFLNKIIKENFKKEKPTIEDLSKLLNKSRTWIGTLIDKNELRNLIKYYPNNQENILLNVIKGFYKESIIENSSKILNGKEIDIYLPNLKLGIEFNGNYWHCDKLKENNYHQDKSKLAKDLGIKLIHIFEYEWNQKYDIITNYLKDIIIGPSNIVGARKCQIKELDYKTYAAFCNENHLQGECGARVKLGLFYKNNLIQVMSFGSPRFTSDYEWEIIRECSKLGYCIIGGKEKLWSYFVKNYNPNSVISYCDFGKFDGHSYLKLGFKQERLNKPGFMWLSKDFQTVFWRNPYKHNELKIYNKIYDCGQLVFSWKR